MPLKRFCRSRIRFSHIIFHLQAKFIAECFPGLLPINLDDLIKIRDCWCVAGREDTQHIQHTSWLTIHRGTILRKCCSCAFLGMCTSMNGEVGNGLRIQILHNRVCSDRWLWIQVLLRNSGCRRSGIFTAINRQNCNSTSMERRGEPDLFHSLNMYALATTTKPFIFQVLFLNVVCFSSTLLHTTYVCVLCMCCVCEPERRLCVGCRCMVTTYAPAFVLK